MKDEYDFSKGVRGPIPTERIPMEDCIHGRVYRIHSRNLTVGCWNEDKNGFIGIRTKFGERYLFTEYHVDTGPPYGTVRFHLDTGTDVPDDIMIKEQLGTVDTITGRPIAFDRDAKNPNGEGYAPGWWTFVDTGEVCPAIPSCRSASVFNKALFEFLDKVNL